ncbi:uncharacterized protein LOC111718056, partial [Eurytemora carolleeae]|uniref:uncharacterized protein LOC111718056 n=1 Tax=Eurytemora carolleeae TaxID=1294199 RepID=UPI000C75637D
MFQGEDGKTTVRSSRLILDSEGSSNENIKYQGMDIVTSSKERRNPSRTNSLSRDRQYYGSWENLLENSLSKSNLFNSRNYGSTGSLNSSSESDLGPAQFYQGAGHHLQLHAVHNQSYQTNTTL